MVNFMKDRGFSMVGVLVAAGMAGGLSLFVANITKQQHVAQKKAETGAELTGLQHKILSVLYDGDACTKTLGVGSFLPLSGTNQARALTQLKNKAGTVVVRTGSAGDINRILRVESMTLKNVRGNIGLTREAELEVKIKRLGAANKGHTTVKKFPITVELQSIPNIVARCHHTLNAKEQGIKERMCTEMGGRFVGGTCSIANLLQPLRDEIAQLRSIVDQQAPKCIIARFITSEPKYASRRGSCPSGYPKMHTMNDPKHYGYYWNWTDSKYRYPIICCVKCDAN